MPLSKRRSALLRLSIFFTLAALVLPTLAQPAASERCESVTPRSVADQHAEIKSSGRYCLRANFNQRWLYSVAEGGRSGPHTASLIEIFAAQVDLNLEAKTLSTSTYVDGVVAWPVNFDRVEFNRTPVPNEIRRLVVHNGTIRLHNSDGESSGIGVISPKEISEIHNTHTSKLPPSTFAKVDYILENLTIKTGNLAALLMGDGIVVRNCTIEVDGPNALVIYGPNAVIENNRIVYRYAPAKIRGLAEPSIGRPPEIRAAIYLRAAGGSVIRGNTIEVRDTRGSVSAVAVIDSADVRIEDNRLNSTIPMAALLGRSSAQVRRNLMTGGFLKPDASIPDADLKSETLPGK